MKKIKSVMFAVQNGFFTKPIYYTSTIPFILILVGVELFGYEEGTIDWIARFYGVVGVVTATLLSFWMTNFVNTDNEYRNKPVLFDEVGVFVVFIAMMNGITAIVIGFSGLVLDQIAKSLFYWDGLSGFWSHGVLFAVLQVIIYIVWLAQVMVRVLVKEWIKPATCTCGT